MNSKEERKKRKSDGFLPRNSLSPIKEGNSEAVFFVPREEVLLVAPQIKRMLNDEASTSKKPRLTNYLNDVGEKKCALESALRSKNFQEYENLPSLSKTFVG